MYMRGGAGAPRSARAKRAGASRGRWGTALPPASCPTRACAPPGPRPTARPGGAPPSGGGRGPRRWRRAGPPRGGRGQQASWSGGRRGPRPRPSPTGGRGRRGVGRGAGGAETGPGPGLGLGNPVARAEDRRLDGSRTAWERARNTIRSQQVRDPTL